MAVNTAAKADKSQERFENARTSFIVGWFNVLRWAREERPVC